MTKPIILNSTPNNDNFIYVVVKYNIEINDHLIKDAKNPKLMSAWTTKQQAENALNKLYKPRHETNARVVLKIIQLGIGEELEQNKEWATIIATVN